MGSRFTNQIYFLHIILSLNMCTLSLLEINQRDETQLRLQRQINVNKCMAEARKVGISLKSRYELAAKSLSAQFYALKMQYRSKPMFRGFPDELETLTEIASPKSLRKLSVNAKSFTPNLMSDRSDDSDSPSSTDNSITISGDTTPIVSASEESSDSEISVEMPSPKAESETEIEPPRERLCKLGQVVTGRLNIHRPGNGEPTKYYINWCNRTHDNLLMDESEMKKVFGNLRQLGRGQYFQVTVSHVPEDHKKHPSGTNAVCVPCPKSKVGKRKRHRRKKSIGGRPFQNRPRRHHQRARTTSVKNYSVKRS